jgi:hypothetical protein
MSIAQAIEKIILHPARLIRESIDDYFESKCELTEEVKAKLDESRRDLEMLRFTTRQIK